MFLLAASVPPEAWSAGPGTSAASFLELGFGARPLAMGEAVVAMADDASAVHYNPAGLAYPASPFLGPAPRSYEMMVSQAFQFQDIQMSQLGFVARPFGFSVTRLGLGGIEQRTTETASPDGTFGAEDLALGASYGFRLRDVAFGATAKFIRETIGDRSASAYALDLGALHRFERLPVSVGFGVANLGTPVRFIEQSDPLPLTLRFGTTVGMTRNFPHAISLQLDLPRDSAPVVRVGFEYLGFGPFALRAGYRTVSSGQADAVLGRALGSSASGISQFYGLFMGAGFRSRFGSLDYTILPYGELGNTHRLSFTLQFGKPASAAPGPIGVFK